LLGEEVLPVFVLTLKLVIGTLLGSLLLFKLSDLGLEDLDFLLLLSSASDGALAILLSFSGLLVVERVLGVAVGAAAVHDVLRDVLLLLLGEVDGAADRLLKTTALIVVIIMGEVLVVDEIQAAARTLLRVLVCLVRLAAFARRWRRRGDLLGHFLFKPITVTISD
jgi:hypothetical protein